MVRRRADHAGLATIVTNHTFRATGITAYLKNRRTLEHAKAMAAHASTRTTAGAKRCAWTRWSGS